TQCGLMAHQLHALVPYTTLFRSARLRDGKAGCAVKLEPGAVDGSDRRADRGDGKTGRQFDRIFHEGRGMVGRATRHRDDEARSRSEEHTSELQSRENLVCRPLLE